MQHSPKMFLCFYLIGDVGQQDRNSVDDPKVIFQ